MAKILVVTPTQQMYQQAREVVSEAQLDAKVQMASSSTVLELVRREVQEGTAVVVARGNQAHMLKSEMSVPLVEIILAGQELATIIARAKEMSGKKYPKIALIGFRHMFSNPEPLAQVIGADVQIYYATPPLGMDEVVANACNDGADVIVGGELVLHCAQEYPVKTLFLESSKESLINALTSAKRVLYGIELERRKTNEFMSLLNYSFDAILKLDAEGRVVIANYMAEKLLHRRATELIGMNITALLDLDQDSLLSQAMRQRKSAYSMVVRTQREAFIANIANLSHDGESEGFILSLQEFKRIDEMEETIRSDRYHRGYLAKTNFQQLYTVSNKLNDLFEDARQYAQYENPVLINSPFGYRATQLAECIHNDGIRKKNPYVEVNLAALSPEMQQVQLFVDAGGDQGKSLFEIAHTGTLVLDSVDMLDIGGQYQLLSALEQGFIYQGEGRRKLPVNVRVICTTYVDLQEKVMQKSFLAPLYACISQLELHVPPLREHMEDIPYLLEDFMSEYATKYRKFVTITDEGRALIHAHPWTGDVMQLRRFCEKITLLTREKVVDGEFIRKHLPRVYVPREMPEDEVESAAPPVIYSQEKAEIIDALNKVGPGRTALANYLGISKATLWRRMKKHGLA